MSKFQSVPVDESALKGRFTGPLILSILAASFGSSFIFGYNIGCINSAGDTIKRWIAESLEYKPTNFTSNEYSSDEEFLKNLSDEQKENMESIWSLVVSLFPLGAIFGGVMTGLVADKFGRKGGMLINNILTFAGGLPMFLSKASGSHYLLYVGRFIIGLNCGLNSGLAPMYLTEISPVNYRGLLGTVNQLLVTIAILVSNILGLESLWGNASTWIYLLGFTMVPAVYQLIALPFCPESPRYLLITKGRDDSARNGRSFFPKSGTGHSDGHFCPQI
uniref:Major facilitator superfamily (MFS) profile domain-containing protein n=1 Tax=Romanomermis culicivorax TaxID=13658 RepID=A0A915LD02_ROMCU